MKETGRRRPWRSRIPPWRGPHLRHRPHRHQPLLLVLTCALVMGTAWLYVLSLFTAIWLSETAVWITAQGVPVVWRVVSRWSVYASPGRSTRDTVG